MMYLISQSNSQDLFEKIISQPDTDFGRIYCEKTRFANNEISVKISESVRNKTICIIAQPRDYEDNFELLMTIDAARRASAKEIIAVIPFLPHSRQERRPEGERTTISARLYASMLETAGLDRLITVDLHTTAIEGFYTIPVDNITPFKNFRDILIDFKKDVYNPILVSPDFGGMKRVKTFANEVNLPMAFLNKERLKPNEVGEMTLIGDVKDHNVVIIDDMIDTGGTILKGIDLLDECGANSVTIMATHGIFSNEAHTKLLNNKHVMEVIVTNTLPSDLSYYLGSREDKLNIIDISSNIVEALQKLQ